MKKHIVLRTMSTLSICALLFAGACTPENTLTERERQLQSAADNQVASILFEEDLTQRASYRVHKNGVVVIKFAESVTPAAYTGVVERLRRNADIRTVQAEQAGREVCPLR